jgi:hypothetical protein
MRGDREKRKDPGRNAKAQSENEDAKGEHSLRLVELCDFAMKNI